MRTTVIAIVLVALAAPSAAEQAETCELSGTSYDPATNEVTAIKSRGVTMRAKDGRETCAEPARVQFWMNQGFEVVTDEQRGREIVDRASREVEAERDSDHRNVYILIAAVLIAVILFEFGARRRMRKR